MIINNLSLEEINDKKKQASLWNSFNDESEGRITFMENEARFRYRKNFEGELLVTNSKKSIKDVVEKMRNKEKKKQSLKEQDANLTIEKSITEFYYNEYCRGYSGSNKKRSQRKQTTLLRTHVIIKKQIIETPLNQLNLKAKNGKEISDEELLSYIKNLGKWRFALDDYSDEMTKCGFEPKYKIDGIEE